MPAPRSRQQAARANLNGATFITSSVPATTSASSSATSAATTAATAGTKPTSLPFAKRPGTLQNVIYIGLATLSVLALLYLVYISMQSVTFSPCALMNGTWHLTTDSPYHQPRRRHHAQQQQRRRPAENDPEQDSEAQQQEQEQEDQEQAERDAEERDSSRRRVAVVDLSSFAEYEGSGDTLDVPAEALPINLAPSFVKPLRISHFDKSFSGGAKALHWRGPCSLVDSDALTEAKTRATGNSGDDASASSETTSEAKNSKNKKKLRSSSMCALVLHRGYFALSVFPSQKALQPFSIIGTRLDGNEVADEAAFNKKIKYVLGIMAFVAVIHYILSFFQPPSVKQMRRDTQLGKLLASERVKLQQLQSTTATARS